MTESIAELPGIEDGFLTGSEVGRAWARRVFFSKLQGLDQGSLRWIDVEAGIDTHLGTPEGSTSECSREDGQIAPAESVSVTTVRVHDPRLYPKVLFGGSVGAAEAYMAGLWTTEDLTGVLRFFLQNRRALNALDGGLGRVLAPLRSWGRRLRANTRRGSRRNIKAHYDLSNDFFETFLDSRMMYSSAVYENADQDLEAASLAKLELICQKLDLGPDDHLLEIGSGWGGMAVHAASVYGCRVTTTTISKEQHAAAVERVRAHGLEERVEVLESDYRDLRGTYSKLVSIEMVEAVGLEYLDEYFRVCGERLAPGGLMAIQAITMADRLFEAYKDSVDFIQQYIFPGSSLLSMGSITGSVSRATDLQIVHVEDIGPHYARTTRDWRHRFFARLDEVKALGFSERFVRMWEYYLCYCEAGFEERTIGDLQVVLAKPGYRGPLPAGFPVGLTVGASVGREDNL